MAFLPPLPVRLSTSRKLPTNHATPRRLTVAPIRLCVEHSDRESTPRLDTTSITSIPKTADSIIDESIELAAEWAASPGPHHPTSLAARLAADNAAVAFIMKFTDRVMRSDHASVAARLLSSLVSTDGLPSFLQPLDRFLLALGANLSRSLPALVVPAARVRMRQFVDTFVRDYNHLRFTDRISRNVNLLGEAVLGDEEAARRRNAVLELLQTPGIDYVSVKVSGVTSQLNRWDFDGSLQRVLASLRPLFERALNSDPRVLINLDMEEYHDLEITVSAFKILLEEPQFQDLDAGIVLQTYLPDALPVLQDLVQWAHERPGTGEIKIRLVKGANLAMEKVDAAMHGWTQAPYDLKSETDANYMRCLNWVLTPPRMERVRIGVASHNLFLLAYAHLLARNRGVGHRIGFEMLQGMTPTHTPLLAEQGHGMLLYTPICRAEDFDVAISYLFRRFEETTADGNFLRSLHSLTPESPAFRLEEYRFRTSAAKKNVVSLGPRRLQIRPAPASVMNTKGSAEFCNEPDTDPALRSNRIWAARLLNPSLHKPVSASSRVDTTEHMRTVLERGRLASVAWSEGVGTEKRKALFSRIADEMARRRGDLINAMVFEGRKIFAEADPEVSEAIDFANYYGMRGSELPPNFQNLGLICVAAPWNFPVAISSGGMLAALAAGNSVILKPSSLTPRCAELVAECAWAAGVPRDVLQLVRCSESEVGKTLITESDGVILTGASDTAKMFRSWKNDIRLFAETSGKNALVVSPAADLDLAVADLVQSAFSNTGQRCSAASLCICIDGVETLPRFKRQLIDAVQSLKVGDPSDISTMMGPLISRPDERLYRALTQLDDGEYWLVKPVCLDADSDGVSWTPGVRMGVKPGSWFHQTEVFGPVLGIMSARDLDEALALQNGTQYGLTGGIHTLDPAEVDYWAERVEVGNAYVNRGTTGAIVQRQSFGGWKGSAVGPGAKAGGPNYVAQFGTSGDPDGTVHDDTWLASAVISDELEWNANFSKEHDLANLGCETNAFRYRPLPSIAVRVAHDANEYDARRVRAAIDRCGTKIAAWSTSESAASFANKLQKLNVGRVRVVGSVEPELLEAARLANIHVADDPVTANGGVEMLHYLREQTISRTRHRFGNMFSVD